MPGAIDGIELARRTREKRPTLKILLTTEYPDLKMSHSFDRSFMNWEVLKKPYRRNDLQVALHKILSGSLAQSEFERASSNGAKIGQFPLTCVASRYSLARIEGAATLRQARLENLGYTYKTAVDDNALLRPLCPMAPILFRCPTTGLKVQGWIADDPSVDQGNTYTATICVACQQAHFVNPASGTVLGADDGEE